MAAVKIALRQLLKTPGFTVVALLTLALGIGVNTSAFSVLNYLLFGSQPYPETNRMVQIWSTSPQFQNGNLSPGDFCDFREQSTSFAHLSVYYVNSQKSLALPDNQQFWASYQQQRQQELLALLRQPRTPEHVTHELSALLVVYPDQTGPQAYQDAVRQMRTAVKTMALAVDQQVTADQRRHAVAKLQRLIDQLHDLQGE